MTSWDFGGGATPPPTGDWGNEPPTTPAPAGPNDPQAPIPVNLSAPVVWLVAGIVVSVAAVTLNLVTSSPGLAGLAWVLGGPVAIGLLGVFIQRDTMRRADPWYAESGFTPWGRRVLVVVSLLAVALSAWTIADFVARGGL